MPFDTPRLIDGVRGVRYGEIIAAFSRRFANERGRVPVTGSTKK